MLVLAMIPPMAAASSSSSNATPGAASTLSSSAASDVSTNAANGPAEGSASSETLLLEVFVNGHSIDKIGEFSLLRGKLMARPEEIHDLGFKVPAVHVQRPDGLVAFSELPGLAWILNRKKQELYITTSEENQLPMLLRPDGSEGPESHRVIQSGTGITLNYDTIGTFGGGQTVGTGSLDLRAFSPRGIVSSQWLGFAGTTSGNAEKNKLIRVDSAYTFADVNSLRRYSLGDFITGSLAWTRPVHLGGVQIRSDFSMRPDLITFPLPSVTGSAAVPSSVTVLADGNLVLSSQVAAGPFEVPQIPVISGAGTITMMVTNALGQQVTVSQPFYASSTLLSPGLKTFAVQSGLVRTNWGTVSNDYGKIAGIAMYRRGLTRQFTVEGNVEGTPGTFLAGAGGVLQIGNLGVVNFAAAASDALGNPGLQFAVGAQRIGRIFSIGGSAIIATRNYRDVATMNGGGVLRKQMSAFTGLSLRRYGSPGIAYSGIDQDAFPISAQSGGSSSLHSHVFSASYSIQFHRLSIFASQFVNLVGSGNNGLQVGVTIPFGKRASVDVGASSDGNGQMQVQQSAPIIGDWGYQAYLAAGESPHEFAEVQYKSPVGLFTAGIDNSAGQTTFLLEAEGALSLVDHGIFPSNTIFDSFAVVDTSPMPHIHVLQENRVVGKTSSSGRLLVPDMRAFDLNRIAIDATDISPDASISYASGLIRPQDRSGVVVKFPIKFSHGALLTLVDQAGSHMPIGSVATLKATGDVFPVGYDGNVYLENLSPHNELTVKQANGILCKVTFDYRPISGDIPSIGPLRCLEQKP